MNRKNIDQETQYNRWQAALTEQKHKSHFLANWGCQAQPKTNLLDTFYKQMQLKTFMKETLPSK